MELSDALTRIENILASKDEVQKKLTMIKQEIRAYGKPMRYNLGGFKFAMYLSFVVVLIMLISQTINPLVFVVLVFTTVVCGVLVYAREQQIKDLSDQIFLLDLKADYGLMESDKQINYFIDRYEGFRQGNDSNKVENVYQHTYQGKNGSFEVTMFTYLYVNRETSSYTDNDGDQQTRTEYPEFRMEGIEFRIPNKFPQMLITTRNFFSIFKVSHSTDSVSFNKLFDVKGENVPGMVAFFQPAVTRAFESLGHRFTKLSFEFTPSSLCIMFANQGITPGTRLRNYGLGEPNDFLRELENNQSLNQIMVFYDFLDELYRHTHPKDQSEIG